MYTVNWRALVLALTASCVFTAEAVAYQRYINITRDAVEAKGANSVVVQIEVPGTSKSGEHSAMHFAPDVSDTQFKNVDIQVAAGAKPSNHSNTVAKLFFGSRRSVADGITTAHIYNANQWLRKLSLWDLDPSHTSQLFPGPVVNHSWVAKPKHSPNILRRADYSALSNNVLHVAGVRRRGAGDHLMAGGFNSLVVGGAMQNIEAPYPAIDDLYGDGRIRPHLVGPYPHASAAAPIVAATAVRLNALAAKNDLIFPTMRNGSKQLPVELVKAILMASASGNFNYEHKDERFANAFGTVGVTANGLDKRYGMGMLNVGEAENLLLATRYSQSSARQPTSKGSGFAYQQLGSESAQIESYKIEPNKSGEFAASLSWLADIQNIDGRLEGAVYDFDLHLVELAADGESQKIVAQSVARFDTTENIRVSLQRGSTYELKVILKDDVNKSWPFAVAWKMQH